jgi:hypothetical protein
VLRLHAFGAAVRSHRHPRPARFARRPRVRVARRNHDAGLCPFEWCARQCLVARPSHRSAEVTAPPILSYRIPAEFRSPTSPPARQLRPNRVPRAGSAPARRAFVQPRRAARAAASGAHTRPRRVPRRSDRRDCASVVARAAAERTGDDRRHAGAGRVRRPRRPVARGRRVRQGGAGDVAAAARIGYAGCAMSTAQAHAAACRIRARACTREQPNNNRARADAPRRRRRCDQRWRLQQRMRAD